MVCSLTKNCWITQQTSRQLLHTIWSLQYTVSAMSSTVQNQVWELLQFFQPHLEHQRNQIRTVIFQQQLYNRQPQQQHMFSKNTSDFLGKKSTSITMIECDKSRLSEQSQLLQTGTCKQTVQTPFPLSMTICVNIAQFLGKLLNMESLYFLAR